MSFKRPMIGLSPRLLRQVPRELGFRGKTLQYLEQSVAHWAMSQEAITVMIPSVARDAVLRELPVSVTDFAERLDGLILQGGADIHPSSYGQAPKFAESSSDVVRDRFELDLLRAFIALDKPVLGICRGMQLINIVFGGSLHQDLLDASAATDPHVQSEVEEDYRHGLVIEPNSWLSRLHDGLRAARVNSIHHQGVDRLGEGLQIEARSHDGVIEAIRHPGFHFVVGVQWHPEYHDERYPDLLPAQPMMTAFLEAANQASSLRPAAAPPAH